MVAILVPHNMQLTADTQEFKTDARRKKLTCKGTENPSRLTDLLCGLFPCEGGLAEYWLVLLGLVGICEAPKRRCTALSGHAENVFAAVLTQSSKLESDGRKILLIHVLGAL